MWATVVTHKQKILPNELVDFKILIDSNLLNFSFAGMFQSIMKFEMCIVQQQ